MSDRISDEFSNSKFALEYIKIIDPILSSHMDIYLEEMKKKKRNN
tara:strand:- start:4032 stop:4166 length:135 start_codon:yes stop_codon:yes gene_type:complete